MSESSVQMLMGLWLIGVAVLGVLLVIFLGGRR